MTELVNSVVARCLLEPGYLERFAFDPHAEAGQLNLDESLRQELGGLDVQRVRRFGGFITKVQHNDLWDYFPYTRALLKLYGEELDTFVAYRPEHLRLGATGRPSRETKTKSFLSFLERRLEAAPAGRCRGLLDVVRHERLLWEVAQELSKMVPRARSTHQPASATLRAGSIVIAHDVLRVAAFTFHPLEALSGLKAGTLQLAGIKPHSTCLGYWGRADDERVRVLELDALSATVLAATNGRRTVRAVIRDTHDALAGAIAAAEVRTVLAAAADRGLIRIVVAAP